MEKVCLPAVYDDNSSKSKEEALVMTKFDGFAVGTKGGGIQKMVISAAFVILYVSLSVCMWLKLLMLHTA